MLIKRRDITTRNIRSSETAPRELEKINSHANLALFAAHPHAKFAANASREGAQPPVAASAAYERPESRKLLVAMIVSSAALHAAAIAAAMPRDSGEQFGAVAEKSDAVSLSMTQTVVLESISTDAQAAAASAAASQAGGVQSAESKPQELAEVKDLPVSDQPPPKPIKVADATPAAVTPTEDPLPVIRGGGEADSVSEVNAEQIAEKPVEEMPEELETKEDEPEKAKREKEVKKESKVQQTESHAQSAGSATSRSTAAQVAVNGRVSASSGNVLTYAASIRAQVERNKPSGNGLRGTVRVSFGITAMGELCYLRLAGSSGNAILDEAALAAVRRAAPFGAPPPELAGKLLAFVIPFYFR